jgi:N-acetylneuraminic acid mutarotase
VVGGYNGTSYATSAEVYDVKAGTFSSVGSLHTARADHTATLLLDGTVLIAGGCNTMCVSAAELFDPITNDFSATNPMVSRRGLQTATLLQDGRVLITGGYDGTAAFLTAELYS